MQETISSSMIRKKGKHPPLSHAGWGPDVVQETCEQRYCSLSLLSRTAGQVAACTRAIAFRMLDGDHPPFPDLNRETSSREKCTNIHAYI